QKDDCAIQIIRLARSLQWNSVAEVLDPFLIFVKDFVLFGAKPTRRKAIYRDAMSAPIIRQTHGQLANSASACAVWSEPCVACNAGHRSDIDDAPVPTRYHSPSNRLRHEKTSAQIRIENQVPIVPGHIESGFPDVASCIVNENVEM